jgi:hypothetical protein
VDEVGVGVVDGADYGIPPAVGKEAEFDIMFCKYETQIFKKVSDLLSFVLGNIGVDLDIHDR